MTQCAVLVRFNFQRCMVAVDVHWHVRASHHAIVHAENGSSAALVDSCMHHSTLLVIMLQGYQQDRTLTVPWWDLWHSGVSTDARTPRCAWAMAATALLYLVVEVSYVSHAMQVLQP